MDKYFYYAKKFSILTMILFTKLVWSDTKDELLLMEAKSEGFYILNSCILTPPVDPSDVTRCTALYTKYISTITVLNAPKILTLNQKSSSYSSSPFDICRFEIATLIFGEKIINQPYCPN